MAHTTCLVCLVSTVSGRNKKRSQNAHGKGGASSGLITKLEQSRFSLDIYGLAPQLCLLFWNVSAVSMPPSDMILTWLACTLNDVIFVYIRNN